MISTPSTLTPLLLVPATSAFSTLVPTPIPDANHSSIHHHNHPHRYYQTQDEHGQDREQDHEQDDNCSSRRYRPTSSVSRVARRSIGRQRKSSPFSTTESSIFGKWDIHIKSEHRPLARGKSRSGSGGGRGGNTTLPSSHPGTQPSSSSSSPLTPKVENSPNLPTTLNHKGRMPSSTNLASNATTAWTIGQQRAGNRINVMPTDGTFVNHTGVAVTTEPLSQLLAPKSTFGPSHSQNQNQNQNQSHAPGDVPVVVSAAEASHASPFSARSTFLRAIGKFRNKHQQKRSAPSVAASGNSASAPSVPVSTTSSFVLPPMQFEHTVSMESDRSVVYSNGTVSMISFADSSRTKDSPSLELHDIDMEDSPQSQPSPASMGPLSCAQTEAIASGPSLRTKFKNKVNSTLASIKSTSNLKDKSRSQASSQSSPTTFGAGSPYGSSQVSPTTIATSTSQYDGSNPTTPKTLPLPSKSTKASKPFWTFPRSRPESEGSKQLPWGDAARPNSYSGNSVQEASSPAQDAVMVSPELGPTEGHAILQALGDVKPEQDLDSDDSIDIIMPSDYDDYTPFAELSAKKRKKMEAAAAAAKDPLKKTHAMKRLLDKGKKKDQSNKSSTVSSSYERTESLTKPLQPRNSKKRPKDQDSIEQAQGQEPNKLIKGNSEEPPEWRRALMKSLHLGRNKARRISKDDTPDASQDGQGQVGDDSGARPRRSDSINSIRSRSLTTSTHAALLATTIPKPRGMALRRETLEMAMRRRRRSSAARSNLFVDDAPMSGSARNSIYGDANITHTFTSFTFELADMYAHDVVNNSATPGLFNFKRPPRKSISAPGADTSQEFQGFDSDGDALSGYTGDADISMEEIFVRPRTPSAASVKLDTRDKGKSRDSGAIMSSTAPGRRKLSIIDAESDTVPELPTLTIRTRDLNRSNGHGRSGSYGRSQYMENSGDSQRSPPRRASGITTSPTLHRKPSRNLASAYNEGANAAASKATFILSMDDVVSWKPRNVLQQTPPRPVVPAVDTTKPALTSRGSELSSSTTLIPSSRTPYSANSSAFAHSPGLTQTASKNVVEPHPLQPAAAPRHQRQPSLQAQSQHQQQPSADTLLPQHLKNFSTASTLSASSGYSAQTLTSHSGLSSISQPVEFDPSQKFPTTPVDLKTMDFEALLQMAELEQRKGRDELGLQKKSQATPAPRLSIEGEGPSPSPPTPSSVGGKNGVPSSLSHGLRAVKNKSLPSQAVSAPNLETLGRQSTNNNNSSSNSNNNSTQSSPGGSSKGSGIHQLYTNSRALPKSATTASHSPQGRANPGVAFDLGPEGHNRSSQPRSKRVMKKKMSVIKLSGAVQGGRDHDGVIRVSVSSSGDPNQWRSS